MIDHLLVRGKWAGGVVGVAASGSVLGGCSVAQSRMPVSVVVLVFEVADDHSGLEQGVPVVGFSVNPTRAMTCRTPDPQPSST